MELICRADLIVKRRLHWCHLIIMWIAALTVAATAATIDINYNASDADAFWNHHMNRRKAAAVSLSTQLNSIDACWRSKGMNWAKNRMQLADCVIGFGGQTTGGQGGRYYVVNDSSDDAQNPKPGTLRYGVIQLRPLWIVFASDMTITLQNELIFTSHKTIDGRGANVHIAYGPCITIQGVRNVIVHGINIHNCRVGTAGLVRSSTKHIGYRQGSDGDAISVFHSTNVWIDHNSFASCADGLIDVIHASTNITISNNYFSNHNKVMLFGHNDAYKADKVMNVTLVFNHFGPNLVQRMPRVRYGLVHVINNNYEGWTQYAIGGSKRPTIFSQGNRFYAPNTQDKQVTKREGTNKWKAWVWKSMSDTFYNGAYFVQSGPALNATDATKYGVTAAQTFTAYMTQSAGALSCDVKLVSCT